MDRPDAMDRKTSFNPEAVVFSPTIAEESTTPAGSRISAMPNQHSPLGRTKSLHAQLGDATSDLQQVSVGDLLSMGVPMDVLARTLSESEINSTQELTGLSLGGNTFGQHTTGFPAPLMGSFMLPPQRTEPNFSAVDVNELSASLGLPSAKKSPTADESPARSQISRTSKGAPHERYAHYMKSQSESSDDTIKAYQNDQSNTAANLSEGRDQALKVVPPPPGFGNQMPRMVTVEDQLTANDSIVMPQTVTLPFPYGYYQCYPNFSQPTIPLQQQQQQPPPPPMRPTPRRRERRPTRTKRTDQGPEPSAADIYPDDAHWTPPQHQQQQHNYFAPRPLPYVSVQPQPVVQPSDATSWPTPAEVYKPVVPQAPVAPAHAPQDFNIFASHTSPTHEDVSAADTEVLSLLDELPDPTIQTLINFGAFDLLPEDRPLSPGQLSGKRYGLNYHGIGLGDDWKPPVVKESDPFRVRPRDHAGWGGWEWAIKKGWGDV